MLCVPLVNTLLTAYPLLSPLVLDAAADAAGAVCPSRVCAFARRCSRLPTTPTLVPASRYFRYSLFYTRAGDLAGQGWTICTSQRRSSTSSNFPRVPPWTVDAYVRCTYLLPATDKQCRLCGTPYACTILARDSPETARSCPVSLACTSLVLFFRVSPVYHLLTKRRHSETHTKRCARVLALCGGTRPTIRAAACLVRRALRLCTRARGSRPRSSSRVGLGLRAPASLGHAGHARSADRRGGTSCESGGPACGRPARLGDDCVGGGVIGSGMRVGRGVGRPGTALCYVVRDGCVFS